MTTDLFLIPKDKIAFLLNSKSLRPESLNSAPSDKDQGINIDARAPDMKNCQVPHNGGGGGYHGRGGAIDISYKS